MGISNGLESRAQVSRESNSQQNESVNDPAVVGLIARARDAHIALMKGDIALYRRLMPLDERFTLMSPFGHYSSRGNSYTEAEWMQIGSFFRNGRDSTFEPVQVCAGSDVIVVAAIEYSNVEVGGLPAQPWNLRVTMVFRKQGNQWLLAHRHADPLGHGIDLKQSAALACGPI